MTETPLERDAVDHVVSAETSRRLYQLGLAGLAAVIGWFIYTTPHEDVLLVALGVGMAFAAAWPILQWARQTRPWFPMFEIYMLVGLPFYAGPFMSRTDILELYPPGVVLQSAVMVLLFQGTAIFTFERFRARGLRARAWTEPLVPERWVRYSMAGIWLNTAYVLITNLTQWIPSQLGAPLRAVFFGLGVVGTFTQARLWGLGKLPPREKAALVGNLLVQAIFQVAALYLISVIGQLSLAMIAYCSGSRKVPLVALVSVLVPLAVLHNGKSTMRDIYWGGETRGYPTIAEMPGFFAEWIGYGLRPPHLEDEERVAGASLVERASLFQMLALTVNRVPEHQPYLAGESYLDVPALLVPRLLWPDKPSTLVTNVRLALYFGLVNEESAGSVSIAFGMLAEAYANFGAMGALGLGFLLGAFFRKVSIIATGAAIYSAAGLFSILLTAWSLQVEMVMGTWVSSLFQATLVVVIGPMLAKRFLGW